MKARESGKAASPAVVASCLIHAVNSGRPDELLLSYRDIHGLPHGRVADVADHLANSALLRAKNHGGACYYAVRMHQARIGREMAKHYLEAGDYALGYLAAYESKDNAARERFKVELLAASDHSRVLMLTALASCVSVAPGDLIDAEATS